MKILFLTVGNELVASSRTRVFQYLPYLHKKKIATKVLQYESGFDYWLNGKNKIGNLTKKILKLLKFFDFFFTSLAVCRLIRAAPHYDIIFIQKVLLPIVIQKWLAKRNPVIVFDCDDAIYASSKYNMNRLRHICSLCKLAVIENDNTETYMREKGVTTVKITGPIDCARYRPSSSPHTSKRVVVGWIGSPYTSHYLREIEKPLRHISQEFSNVEIWLIGAGNYSLPGCRMESFGWSLNTEISLLEQFDIGIMPLTDDEWTRGKGGYKMLQYMAMGIPSIASPVGVNSQIMVDDETGFLARTDEEWHQAFEKLIADKNLRLRTGKNARKRAEDLYSFEANTPVLVAEMEKLLA